MNNKNIHRIIVIQEIISIFFILFLLSPFLLMLFAGVYLDHMPFFITIESWFITLILLVTNEVIRRYFKSNNPSENQKPIDENHFNFSFLLRGILFLAVFLAIIFFVLFLIGLRGISG